MNKFEKISFEEYKKSINRNVDLKQEYNDIKLPKRATKKSAGYDIFSPYDFELDVGESIRIHTGIKVQLNEQCFLAIVPRSSLGFNYRIQLDNTIGIIDGDYYNNIKNEGHIAVKITNDGKENKKLTITKCEAFAQGIILSYGLTDDDNTTEERVGGTGSTNKK